VGQDAEAEGVFQSLPCLIDGGEQFFAETEGLRIEFLILDIFGAMGVMGSKFGSAAAAYSYLIFVLLYIPCISVMGAIARESSR
uniref:nucleoside recognition domain-containing protein n=1 Tax=Klebsiella pneumoniae TaxID=573 RepID=UPI00214AA92C